MKAELELSEWGCDGSLRLAFWNYMSGDDSFFRLNPDGTIDRRTPSSDEDVENWEPVNAHDALRELLVAVTQEAVETDRRWKERQKQLKQ